jgi:hypothetical protein
MMNPHGGAWSRRREGGGIGKRPGEDPSAVAASGGVPTAFEEPEHRVPRSILSEHEEVQATQTVLPAHTVWIAALSLEATTRGDVVKPGRLRDAPPSGHRARQ